MTLSKEKFREKGRQIKTLANDLGRSSGKKSRSWWVQLRRQGRSENIKLIVISLFLVMSGMAVFSIFLIGQTRGDLLKAHRENTEQRADYYAAQVLNQVRAMREALSSFSRSPLIQDLVDYKDYGMDEDFGSELVKMKRHLENIVNHDANIRSMEINDKNCGPKKVLQGGSFSICEDISENLSVTASQSVDFHMQKVLGQGESIHIVSRPLRSNIEEGLVIRTIEPEMFMVYRADPESIIYPAQKAVNRIAYCFFGLFVFIISSIYFLWRGYWRGVDQITRGIRRIARGEQSQSDGSTSPLFSGVIEQLNQASQRVEESYQLQKEAAIGKISSQVAHDIRSPLTTLAMLEKSIENLPEEKKQLLHSSIARIRGIASQLSMRARKAQQSDPAPKPVLQHLEVPILPVLRDTMEEKRFEFKDDDVLIHIDQSLKNPMTLVQADDLELRRILSNLINNSVQAKGEDPIRITLHLEESDECVLMICQDNGAGIASDNLEKIFERGVSLNQKHSGSGLGLYHARSTMKRWGGDAQIQSVLGNGTSVTLRFLRQKSPRIFLEKLQLDPGKKVVVVDDEPGVHAIWSKRIENVEHLYSLENLLPAALGENALYLVDNSYQGVPESGIQAIQRLRINQCSTLVSSMYFDREVIRQCQKMGVKILPKCCAEDIPLEQPLT